MSRRKGSKQRYKRRKNKQQYRRGLELLLSAALSFQGLAIFAAPAYSQAPPEGTFSFQYWNYVDAQRGAKRITVNSPMAYFNMPIGDSDSVEGSFVLDTVSGASPYYLSTLSGASGMGINDSRDAGDLKYTHSFERFSIGVGGNASSENDYDSLGATLETRIWSEDKNTTLAFGISGSDDSIGSSIDTNLNESKKTGAFLIGVTQVLDTNSIMQSNITFESGHGYYSDPYKPLDNRPNSRNQWAWLTRYNQFIEEFNAALHLDYRLCGDSFGMTSHMLEAAWYQPFLESWLFRPSIRYYTQSQADFFHDSFPPPDQNQLYTADQRFSAFGGISGGLKIVKDLGSGYSAEISGDYFIQRQDLRPGSTGSSEIVPFDAWFWSLGFSKKF